jgi:hypothetical protein
VCAGACCCSHARQPCMLAAGAGARELAALTSRYTCRPAAPAAAGAAVRRLSPAAAASYSPASPPAALPAAAAVAGTSGVPGRAASGAPRPTSPASVSLNTTQHGSSYTVPLLLVCTAGTPWPHPTLPGRRDRLVVWGACRCGGSAAAPAAAAAGAAELGGRAVADRPRMLSLAAAAGSCVCAAPSASGASHTLQVMLPCAPLLTSRPRLSNTCSCSLSLLTEPGVRSRCLFAGGCGVTRERRCRARHPLAMRHP